MLAVTDLFVESLPFALIITDQEGRILKANGAALKFLEERGLPSPVNIEELDHRLKHWWKDKTDDNCFYRLDKLTCLSVFRARYEEMDSCLLYAINDEKAKIKRILDCVDEAVFIYSKDQILEMANNASTRIMGLSPQVYIGSRLKDILEAIQQKESAALEVFKTKKKMSTRIKYNLTGKTVTLTGEPLFDREGEIEKIIITGRDITSLVELEQKLLETGRLNTEYYAKLKELEEYLGDKIIYSSDKIKGLLRIAIKAAQTESPVFIWGESGVGKEIFANLIHNVSPRKEKPFIAINCATIPHELLESELFGHEEGAFTGAKKQGKKGLLEEANGGTVFLDEIGELPTSMQSKLLRVIQDNGFMRVGGNRFIPINVRYISATNLTVEQLKDNKRFRTDLFYRLMVIPLNIPPLRERKEDIFPLIRYFLNLYNKKYNLNVKLSAGVMEKLYNYDWPGNIRELRNVVERLVVLADSDVVTDEVFLSLGSLIINNNGSKPDGNGFMSYHQQRDAIIKATLEKEPNVVRAARILGISPSTIYRKLKKMNQ